MDTAGRRNYEAAVWLTVNAHALAHGVAYREPDDENRRVRVIRKSHQRMAHMVNHLNSLEAQMKENQIIKPVIDLARNEVSFEFQSLPTLTLHMDKVHPDNVARAALTGMAQVRIVDAAAVSATDKAGNIVPAKDRTAEKHRRMKALIDFYESGTREWARTREAAVAPLDTILLAALVELYPAKDEPEIRVWLSGLKPNEQKALALSEKVKSTYDRIQKSRVVVDKDVEAKLEEFLA